MLSKMVSLLEYLSNFVNFENCQICTNFEDQVGRRTAPSSVDSAVGKLFHLLILSLANFVTCKFCYLQVLQIADIS